MISKRTHILFGHLMLVLFSIYVPLYVGAWLVGDFGAPTFVWWGSVFVAVLGELMSICRLVYVYTEEKRP